MCLDRGGIVGEDGVTHHGVFDMAAFGAVPGLTIAAPMDELELRNMMYTGLQYGHPFMIRYPARQRCGTSVARAFRSRRCPSAGAAGSAKVRTWRW